MTDASNQVLKALQERGYRLTEARKKIVTVLAQSKTSMTIQELAEQVSVDAVSVYRTIDTLQKEELLTVIKIIGEKDQYELAHDHHHHLVCSGCGLVAHVPCEQVKRPTILPKDFATIDMHEVTFYGRCTKCV